MWLKISKTFGATRALDGVSFDVPKNSIFGLLGPNGAGKTTFFSIVANFIRPDEGLVEVLGHDVSRISELRGRLTILPQDALFQRNVPIVEQLVFFLLLNGRSRPEAEAEVLETLADVGLEMKLHDRVPHLSHGMTKRLGIAQAFLGEPEVILLDEPTAGLDPANARQIREIIHRLSSRATILISSHNLRELEDLCDHVAILDQGRLVGTSAVADIKSGSGQLDLLLSRDLTEEELQAVLSTPRVLDVTSKASKRYTATLDADAADEDVADETIRSVLGQLIEYGIAPRQVRSGRTLEEHFLSVTGRKSGAPPGPNATS